MIEVSLPARINIVGSPTDAVEGAYATISAAVALRGGARISAGDELAFQRPAGERAVFARAAIADPRGFDIEAAAVNALLRHAPEFAERLTERGAEITTWTDVPASSGLAGSSVLVLAVLAALRAFYGLDLRRYNDYVLAEIGQRAEEHDMGVVCGFADRYTPLLGDLAYLSYHGKLWHAPLGEEPFATYEKLGGFLPPLRFVVATTGVRRDSGSVHAPMRARYLEERRRGSGALLAIARQLGATAWRGKIALLAGDLAACGEQINRNQALIDEMMRLCGFASGAGDAVNALIAAAHEAGALGAKLTGAGGGGAIFALPAPGGEESLADAVRRAAQHAGLSGSEVLILPVSPTGLRVTHHP
jgi:galactokinase/mevalonate kinase-like predicted kinase